MRKLRVIYGQSLNEWLTTVPDAIAGDPLWRMKVYRLAVFVGDLAWHDVTKLVSDRRTVRLVDRLFRAVGSVGANIAEGYGRQSGKDRVRFYEYALGSARESRHWYYTGRHVLPEKVVAHRMGLLVEVCRLLLAIIPEDRDHNLAEEQATYEINLAALLDNPPSP